ncbi:putative malate dehydrogenase 1B [Saccostrea cucullata]|uniref:putative malate dehydrogenase 1B n=1 Tax=Saccostrea cuccullata TaxID=36930 RepID=UPI002ED1D653
MAKIVIAGKSNCPYYARSELLGDKLSRNLPDFQLHKIVVKPEEWDTWLKDTCSLREWEHKKSPLVWRELIDRGGKGVLIGGANEFQEYANGYYGVQSTQNSEDMQKISEENKAYKIEEDKEEEAFKALSHPLHVCITNASNPVCYNLVDAMARGDVFGDSTEISLHLLDDKSNMESLEGLKMEAMDLAHGLLREIIVTSEVSKAFKGCDAIVVMNDLIQSEKESRDDFVKRSVEYHVKYAKAINDNAKKEVKVLVTGNGPTNLNVYMMIENAPNIPKQNIVGLSRRLENNAKSVVAEKLSINPNGVVDLIVWGNINGDSFIDISKCRVHGYDGAIWGPPSFSLPAAEMIWDKKWMENEFVELVKNRHQKSQELMGHSASMSRAAAIETTLAHWWNGSPQGQIFSFVVASEGWYDVPEGLPCSFPVTISPEGSWSVVQDLEQTDAIKEKIKAAIKDIIADKNVIYPPPKPPTPPPSEVKVTIVDPKNQEKTDGDKAAESDSNTEAKLATIIEEKTADSLNLKTPDSGPKPE